MMVKKNKVKRLIMRKEEIKKREMIQNVTQRTIKLQQRVKSKKRKHMWLHRNDSY